MQTELGIVGFPGRYDTQLLEPHHHFQGLGFRVWYLRDVIQLLEPHKCVAAHAVHLIVKAGECDERVDVDRVDDVVVVLESHRQLHGRIHLVCRLLFSVSGSFGPFHGVWYEHTLHKGLYHLKSRRPHRIVAACRVLHVLFGFGKKHLPGVEFFVRFDEELHGLNTLPCIVQNLVIAACRRHEIKQALVRSAASPDLSTLAHLLWIGWCVHKWNRLILAWTIN
jgi:hypothetical protein